MNGIIIFKLLIIIHIFTSCHSNQKRDTDSIIEKNHDSNIEANSAKLLECKNLDTIIVHDKFVYQLLKTNLGDYELSWGKTDNMRVYPERFECWKNLDNEICDFTPKLERMTNDEIIIKVTTSTPSVQNCSPIEYKMILLPRSVKEKPYEIEFYLMTEKNYVVFSNGYDTLSVLNIKTKRSQSFELKPKPYFEFKTINSSIGSIKIINGELHFKYFIGTYEDYKYTKRSVKLNI